MNFLLDILFDISNLCLSFQKNDIEFNEVFNHLEICLDHILKNKIDSDEFGENFNSF